MVWKKPNFEMKFKNKKQNSYQVHFLGCSRYIIIEIAWGEKLGAKGSE